MTSWRTVHGHIQRLDPTLVTDQDVAEFFKEERILGRGAPDAHGGFDFEVAIAGRRRRVATLDEEGTVFRGRSVGELVDVLRERLRKVEVELDGEVAHGPFDLGAVDVFDDFDDDVESAEPVDAEPKTGGAEPQPAGADELEPADAEPEPAGGPALVVVDMPMSEVPALVKSEGEPVAVLKLGGSLVLVADQPIGSMRTVFPRPSYIISLRTAPGEAPSLLVRRDNISLTWDWSGELPVFDWIEEGTEAHAFVVDETGAGAVARLAVADIIDARFADIRNALTTAPRFGVDYLVSALGLPLEIARVLSGTAQLADIPNSRVIVPDEEGSAFEDRLAWELAGEGVVEPSIMGAIRWLYLDRPWAVSVFSALQSAVGGALIATGRARARAGKSWKAGTALGAGVLLSGIVRILTASYAKDALQQRAADISTWQAMHDPRER